MAKNFFDLVKDSFFNPFSNGNIRVNYDLLQLINNKMSLDNLQVVKEEIVNWIVDYVDNCPIDLFDEETQTYESDIRSWSYDKVRYFVRCGWLIEDFEGIRTTYQLDENGIKLLSAMGNAVKDDNTSLEFSGYVYSIYNNLCGHFEVSHAAATVEQIYESGKQLDSMLRGLNVSIKKYLTKLISENKAQPKEILETIFFEYQKKVVLKAFSNFRGKDNPSKYKNYIENKIDILLEESNLEKMIDNYIQTKCDNVNSVEKRLEAEMFYIDKLSFIKEKIEDIEEYIEMLNSRNTKYITTARSRLMFLLNEENDVEGRIIECLKGIKKINDESFYEDSCFDIFVGSHIDDNSLYKPVSKKQRVVADTVYEPNPIDEKELERIAKELFKESELSVNKINDFVISKLEGKDRIFAREIEITEFREILILFLILLYSGNKNVDYKVTLVNKTYKAKGYILSDYILERKCN